jgi:hypothetical protein
MNPSQVLDLSLVDEANDNPINPFYDLYKYYIRLVVNFNVYYFAIGGLLLVYLANSGDAENGSKVIQPLLLVPVALSCVQCIVYCRSIELASMIYKKKCDYLRAYSQKMRITGDVERKVFAGQGFDKYDFNPLTWILSSFSILHCLLFVGLLIASYQINPGAYLYIYSVVHDWISAVHDWILVHFCPVQ